MESGRRVAGVAVGPIVLVGLSGSGKTTVGRRLAHDLGWDFLDLDEEIERSAGIPICRIIAERGEPGFRSMEAEITAAIRPLRKTVIATGGGWMERRGLRDAWPGAVRVWLQVTPVTAVARLAEDLTTRPLLASPDPLAALGDLLARRAAAYGLAEHAVQTEGQSPEDVVARIREAIGL